MPGLNSLNKILRAVRDGLITGEHAKKAKRALGKKPKSRPGKGKKPDHPAFMSERERQMKMLKQMSKEINK